MPPRLRTSKGAAPIVIGTALLVFSGCGGTHKPSLPGAARVQRSALEGPSLALGLAAGGSYHYLLARTATGRIASVEAFGETPWAWQLFPGAGEMFVGGAIATRGDRVCVALDVIDERGQGSALIACASAERRAMLWQKSIASSAYLHLRAIAIDDRGHVYAAGSFAGVFRGGSAAVYADGLSDAIAVALDDRGELRWARRFGGGGAEEATAIAATGDGAVLTGFFHGDSMYGRTTLASADDSVDVAVWRLTSDGNVAWARRIGGPGTDTSAALAVKRDEVHVLATFERELLFASRAIQSAGKSDVLIARFDSEGTPLSASRYGDDDADIALSLSEHGFCVISDAGDYCATPSTDGVRRFAEAAGEESIRGLVTTPTTWAVAKNRKRGDDAEAMMASGAL